MSSSIEFKNDMQFEKEWRVFCGGCNRCVVAINVACQMPLVDCSNAAFLPHGAVVVVSCNPRYIDFILLNLAFAHGMALLHDSVFACLPKESR